MEKAPRFNFFSLTFFFGFGLGGFIGVLLGLLAFGLVQGDEEPQDLLGVVPATATPRVAGITPTPEPRPRTKLALDVRLGPGEVFAVVGTIARGGEVEPIGRDTGSEWLAIRFPPGSSARGWVPVAEVDNLDLENVERLSIVAPTPLPSAVRAPETTTTGGGTRLPQSSNVPFTGGGQGSSSSSSSSSVLATGTPSRTVIVATPTPRANVGPSDLVVTRVSLLADGRVQVTVGNRGPGDLRGNAVFVSVRDLTLRGEQLSAAVSSLAVGGSVSLQSSTFRIERETDIQAIVDPFGNIDDPDRSNNQISITLAPPPTTPTPRPSNGSSE